MSQKGIGKEAVSFAKQAVGERQQQLQESIRLAMKTTEALTEARKVTPKMMWERFTIWLHRNLPSAGFFLSPLLPKSVNRSTILSRKPSKRNSHNY